MIFVVLFLAVCLLFGARAQDDNTVRTDANGKECNQHRQSLISCGMPGIPGSNGMPGMPGVQGPQGRDGSKGDHGPQGLQGVAGSAGKMGPRGAKGSKGEAGTMGTKGAKGDAAKSDPTQQANWKQCVWDLATGTDSGKIKECIFNKLYDNTALKVSFQGNLRVHGDAVCNRWFFKFNGSECSGPSTIEAVVYNNWSSGNPHLLHHRSFAGYCENLRRGSVAVEVWVGKCRSESLGDAYTGWESVSRMMIEEVPPSQ